MEENKNIAEVGADENSAPDFVLRELKADDLFTMTAILGKIGMKEVTDSVDQNSWKAILSYQTPMQMKDGKKVPIPMKEWTAKQRNAYLKFIEGRANSQSAMMSAILRNFGRCKEDVYRLLASGYGINVDTVKNVDAVKLAELMYQFMDRESFSDFFTQALKLTRKMTSLL